MRLRGMRPRKFQMGGGAGGTSFAPLGPPQGGLSPQVLQALAQRQAGGVPGGVAQANPLAQQLAARGAMPTPATGAGPASTLGAAAPGGMMPPGAGGLPGAAGPAGMGNFQPRPGMGWGAPPGAGPMGVPAGGMTGLAGAGGMPGAVPPGMQQQALLGALAGRGSAVPGGGIPGTAPGAPPMGGPPMGGPPPGGAGLGPLAGAGGAGPNPQIAAMLAANPGLAGAGMGFAEGGPVKLAKGGSARTFDSTKAAPGNLAIRSGKGKEPLAKAEGGRILRHGETAGDAPDRPVQRSANRSVNNFDSTGRVGDNLPIRSGKGKEPLAKARGGVIRRRPPVAGAAARNREDRRSPSPAPYYDTVQAGDDGWPPTPSFTAAAGPNAPGMAKGGKWIQGAIKHPGALHKQLGVPQGEKIPEKKLSKAAKAGGKLGERARLAETLKGFKKARGGECVEDKDKDGMRKGGECDRMAAGGAAKQRKHYPNTIPPPKKLAKGGQIRGGGAAERGMRFSGIY